jgi:hypothetical protein
MGAASESGCVDNKTKQNNRLEPTGNYRLSISFCPETALLIQAIHGLHPMGSLGCLIALSCAMVRNLYVNLRPYL